MHTILLSYTFFVTTLFGNLLTFDLVKEAKQQVNCSCHTN